MKYGVIVCPKCKKAKGINLLNKTTKCPRCNKIIIIDKIKITYGTDSEHKMRQVIGLINAKMNGRDLSFKKLLKSKNFY